MNAPHNIPPSTFDAFWRFGYRRLVPIIPPGSPISEKSTLAKRLDAVGKVPGVKHASGLWSSYDWAAHECDEADLARWAAMGANVGIKTGQGIAAIDADTLNQEWASVIEKKAFEHFGGLCRRVGKAPKALYLIALSEPMRYTKLDSGTVADGGRFR